MKTVYVYEIFLDELIIANSGEIFFETENKATDDAISFIQNLIKDSEYDDCIEDDFDINVSEITEDDAKRGW